MIELKPSKAHFEKITSGPWETIERTECRIVIDLNQKIICVTGQSSRDEDWPDNFDFRARETAEQWFPDVKDIKVHAGFLRQYKAVRDKLLDVAYKYPNYAIRVDGFSLGASWPQIFVQDVLYRWPERDIKAVLYAPGNPWRKLPEKYQKALNRCIIYVRSIWDPVTWMRVLRFSRYGKNITIGKWWRILPLQHFPGQMERNLLEKYGE